MIDFRRLEAFCKVYELRSFSKAGTELFLSQPTISAHVSSLEKELDVRLLDRMGRGVLPTPAGEVLYRHAMAAFASLDAAHLEISQLQDVITGEVLVGASTIPAQYMLPAVMSEYMRSFPDVQLQLRTADTEEIIRRVAEGELTIGVVGADTQQQDIVFSPIIDDELIVIAAPSFSFPSNSFSGDALGKLPWILREAGSGTWKTFSAALALIGLDTRAFRCVACVDSSQAVIQCVRAGLGVSVTSRLAVQEFLDRGELVELTVSGLDVRRQFYSIHHSRRQLFPAALHFLKFLQVNTPA
ncbi:selenium metabolism-associated LysR family transcriptional regulator [Oleidesulfovibrio sp.]|uniref:selenium metabolism-associated LysR family transcriptional regulator n=1 Tax=Oleidesulfovibrio sp. TaxID=2909707 RepID=UPI003A848096